MIKPTRPHPNITEHPIPSYRRPEQDDGNPYKGFPNLFRPFFPPFALSYPHILRSLCLPSDDVRERKRKSRPHTPHALTITPVTVSDVVHVERTAQGTRIPDARREHDGRNHHHRRLLAPRPADGMEHVRRRGTRRPAYGRAPPCRWSVQWQGFCESPCLISSACHVDCAEPYGRMAGRFRDMS